LCTAFPAVGWQIGFHFQKLSALESRTTHYVLPHEMLDFVGGYLCYWFNFNPFSKVLNGENEVFHLAYDQREMAQNVYPHVWKGHGL